MASEQAVLPKPSWTVKYDKFWDASPRSLSSSTHAELMIQVLGPFPIHAREQHFISPSFPLNLSNPIDYTHRWPSSYADGGVVGWSQAVADNDGNLEVGWAALQHHAVLRTTVTLYPPLNQKTIIPPRLLVDLKQGSYFALRPQDVDLSSFVPKWCAGNIYNIPHASHHSVDLPTAPSLDGPTRYDIFVSGDYEIRLFGDPLVRESDVPVQQLTLSLQVQEMNEGLVHQNSQNLASDFLSGFAFGRAIGVAVQSIDEWWTVSSLKLKGQVPVIAYFFFMFFLWYSIQNKNKIKQGMTLTIKDKLIIAPSQTRIVPINVQQSLPFYGENLEFTLSLVSGDISKELPISIPIIQHDLLEPGRRLIKGTFFFANSMPSAFIVVPPTNLDNLTSAPPILALHGAGVDILGAHKSLVEAFPDYGKGWLIAPTGRTSWGLDWHGPSADDAWASLEALSEVSREDVRDFPKSWRVPPNSQVIVLGHSNGGQGTWYIASRYPDRVLAAVPASAYIKSQAYVPWSLARSGHFIDPTLRSILDSSLTPDDNDLHLSNLVDTPTLAIHGGDDENVPVWHTREAISTLKAWYPSANIQYKEDPGKGHWYSYVLNNSAVQAFLDDVSSSSAKPAQSDDFTLTVTVPRSDGSLHGWNIDLLIIPGRLHVRKISYLKFEIESSNVHIFSVPIHDGPVEIIVDDKLVQIATGTNSSTQIRQTTFGEWEVVVPPLQSAQLSQNHGRAQHILSTRGPLIIVISKRSNWEEFSAALRLAHVLNVYHALDAEIITEDIALTWNRIGSWPVGNVVFIGTASSTFAKEMLEPATVRTGVRIRDSTVYIGTRKFDKMGQGVLFLHPHPTDEQSLMMFMLYSDKSALEKAIRLFPFRTGVVVPDWLVVGEKMDNFGAGGLEAAGWVTQRSIFEYIRCLILTTCLYIILNRVWNNDWKLSDSMSWFKR
ncbi:hypothetical protein CVT25_015492 [Psilocybe cyanescens]|uniref:Peptidase S9 prolyl oligopeptidase catalytic domain-containing protein n=1 Tax=Psilocybe cyanescens TaxID=93625 RepID=A0A409WI31_PSICY|nr:hypothetical protein CVT25_015492 [Psilocybe cyanescens]